MKNTQKGFIIPLILGIFAVIFIGGGGYFYVKNNNLKKQITENNTVSTTTNTSDWKTYTSVQYGSFQYPKDWTLEDNGAGPMLRKELPDGYNLAFSIHKVGYVEDYVENIIKSTFNNKESYITYFDACGAESDAAEGGGGMRNECYLKRVSVINGNSRSSTIIDKGNEYRPDRQITQITGDNILQIQYGISKDFPVTDHVDGQIKLKNTFVENEKVFQEILDSIKIENQSSITISSLRSGDFITSGIWKTTDYNTGIKYTIDYTKATYYETWGGVTDTNSRLGDFNTWLQRNKQIQQTDCSKVQSCGEPGMAKITGVIDSNTGILHATTISQHVQ